MDNLKEAIKQLNHEIHNNLELLECLQGAEALAVQANIDDMITEVNELQELVDNNGE